MMTHATGGEEVLARRTYHARVVHRGRERGKYYRVHCFLAAEKDSFLRQGGHFLIIIKG